MGKYRQVDFFEQQKKDKKTAEDEEHGCGRNPAWREEGERAAWTEDSE